MNHRDTESTEMTNEIEAAVDRIEDMAGTGDADQRIMQVAAELLIRAESAEARAELESELAKLKTMPCDSDQANEWLNDNAPIHVLESLWAWRRIADAALAGRTVSCVCGGEAMKARWQAEALEWASHKICDDIKYPTRDPRFGGLSDASDLLDKLADQKRKECAKPKGRCGEPLP